MLLTSMCKFLYIRHSFSFFLHIYIGVELLGIMATLFNFLRNFQTNHFPKWFYCFIFLPACICVLLSSHALQHLLLYVFFFGLFRAAPMVYGGSQSRGQIGPVAASLHHSHSNARSEPHLGPTSQLTATPDP